jgi:hypothetical protein
LGAATNAPGTPPKVLGATAKALGMARNGLPAFEKMFVTYCKIDIYSYKAPDFVKQHTKQTTQHT